MSSTLSCWTISDGRRGIENQALGLAEAVARIRPADIEQKTVTANGVFKAAQPTLQISLKSKPTSYGLAAPYPKIAIGCGRQAIAPLRTLKRHCGSDIFTVYIQDPRMNTKHFDLVIAPEHDNLKGENVLSIIGSPNRVTNDRIVVDTLKFNNKIATLKSPRVTMLVGGHSKTHKLDQKNHEIHLNAAKKLLEQGHALMITTSRRTPEFVKNAYQKLASTNVNVWFEDGTGDNPFFAMLGAADAILVTEESTNMLTEACATGKPVFTLPMSGKPGKFDVLYKSLEMRCNLSRFTGNIYKLPYPPLDETARAATELLNRFDTQRLAYNSSI